MYRRPWETSAAPQRRLTLAAPRLATLADMTNPDALPSIMEVDAPLAQDVLAPPAASLSALNLPAYYDWRALGKTPPIRNQGNCGSCWAFATVGVLESAIMIKDGVKNIDLSEQYLVSCNDSGWSCLGGGTAHDYHESQKVPTEKQAGAVLESSFPYKAADVACGGPYNHPYQISSWSFINYETPDVEAIKHDIYTYGPVKVSVCAGRAFMNYRGGIFATNESSACSGYTNHAVVLVGWDDTRGPNGVWILRNSWGTGWGEHGYMYIDRTVSNVGSYASYVDYSGGVVVPFTSQNKFVFLPMVNK
jgi:C1A family cysteine protease